jgi:RNA polymerase sigma factor (sigma-70 family)
MVWVYKEMHEHVEECALLIGEHTGFLDGFFMETTLRCSAGLLRNRTIFHRNEELKVKGAKKTKFFSPAEDILLRTGIDFIYHQLLDKQQRPIRGPFVILQDKLPFVHAVYIILTESFVRSTRGYIEAMDESSRIRLELLSQEMPPQERKRLVLRLASLETKIVATEKKVHGQTSLYGVIKQIKWHMMIIDHLRDYVIRAFRRLAMQLAKKYGRSEQQTLDNYQHGSIGLQRAVNYFDPDRNKAFSGLARNWIRAGILLHLKTEANLMKVPNAVWQQHKKLEDLAHDNGVAGDLNAIARLANMPLEDVDEIYRLIQMNRPVSLESPVSEEEPGSTQLKDNIPDESATPEGELIAAREDLGDYMQALDEYERLVVCCSFGAYDLIPHKQLDPQDVFSERLRQIAVRVRHEISGSTSTNAASA